jgi:orotate phosphoribosyltransferase
MVVVPQRLRGAVLIVDDLVATGATIREAMRALSRQGLVAGAAIVVARRMDIG